MPSSASAPIAHGIFQPARMVPEITSAELARRIAAGERIMLLSVRERDEYAQSRIPGAAAEAVLAGHGTRMAGATVVCSTAPAAAGPA